MVKFFFPIPALFLFSFLFIFHINTPSLQAQVGLGSGAEIDDDEMDVGGDIFSDYNEDFEEGQVLEDERFYRYGRFYSFLISAGTTTFTGNRGQAYQDKHPSLGLSLLYFMNFRLAFGMGFALSEHYFILLGPTRGFNMENGVGLIDVNMFRSHVFFRYYLDTFDLGTAITYANPYFVSRMEFWYQTSKFVDQDSIPNDSNGAIGMSAGFGLEFPIELREYYIGFELLFHTINFKDKYTQLFRPVGNSPYGYNDLSGNAITAFLSYVISW